MKRGVAFLLAAALTGCAAPYPPLPLPPSHPASAAAAEAPPPPVSRSLVEIPAPQLPVEPEEEGLSDPHAGHEMKGPLHGGHR